MRITNDNGLQHVIDHFNDDFDLLRYIYELGCVDGFFVGVVLGVIGTLVLR
jgi:hypothetical protein